MTGRRACAVMMRIALIAWLAGCSPVATTRDQAAGIDATRLDSGLETWRPAPVSRLEGLSLRVTPLAYGAQALNVWLDAIDSAQRSINIKTFIFRSDPVGLAFEQALLDAADRGVRVRLLLDDFFHRWERGDTSRLASHPNIDVRLFNPHSVDVPAPIGFLADFSRVNRRMHSKMILIDEGQAIIGGRNIADEYFLKDPTTYFSDFDILVEGQDVRRFESLFRSFWTDELSVPISRMRRAEPDDGLRLSTLSAPRIALRRERSRPRSRSPGPTFNTRATLHADPPERILGTTEALSGEVESAFLSALAAARSDVLVVTPYLIPEAHGARLLETLAGRGVTVTILTNSHASTNHPSVHAGYMRYRQWLLRAGVRIFEFRGGAVRAFEDGDARYLPSVVMHAKLAVIDRQTSLIGSPNFDPRSLRQNAELLLRLEDPALATWLHDRYADAAVRYGFRVTIGESGAEEWEYLDGEDLKRRSREPLGSALDSAVTSFFRLFPFDRYL